MVFSTNTCQTGNLEFKVYQRMMSGSPDTSWTNTHLNALIASFLALDSKYPNLSCRALASRFKEVQGFFEGDDGIMSSQGIDKALFEANAVKLGLKLKLEWHPDYTTASFCGIVQPSKTEHTILTNPTKVMCNFFVLDPKFQQTRISKDARQLRAKALSYYYMYANCPINGPLSYAALERTRSVTVDGTELDSYHNESLREALQSIDTAKKNKEVPFHRKPPVISAEARRAVDELYGYNEREQLDFEQAFALWGKNLPHAIPTHENLHTYEANSENQRCWADVHHKQKLVNPIDVLPRGKWTFPHHTPGSAQELDDLLAQHKKNAPSPWEHRYTTEAPVFLA